MSRKSNQLKTSRLSVELTIDQKQYLSYIADKNNHTISYMIRQMIDNSRFALLAAMDKDFKNEDYILNGQEIIVDQTKNRKYTPKSVKHRNEKDSQISKQIKDKWNGIEDIPYIIKTDGGLDAGTQT